MSLADMSDDALFTETVRAISRAAVGEAQGGDDPSYDYATQLLAESRRRHVAAGHTDRCGGSIYARAYEQAIAIHAFRTAVLPGCSCGAEATQ